MLIPPIKVNIKSINFLSAVNYIDSSGIAVLIESKQRAGEGSKEFKIVKPSEAVVSVLKLAKLTSFFDIEN